jgi:ATP-binding cassette subfamily B protein
VAKLETLGLTYAYPGSRKGISEIDLYLARGSFTVVAGRTRAGKTTLLHVLLGLLPMDAGKIRWNGETVRDPASVFVPPRCIYIAQTPWPRFSQSLEKNILTGLLGRSGHPPELLVLDDLSNALDIGAERALWDRVFEHGVSQRTSTCLVVSNRKPALRRADRIVVLVKGKVEAKGTLGTLLDTCAEMRRIWRGDPGSERARTEWRKKGGRPMSQ